ncbi:MAG: ABC transporter permease [Terriglobia bacterium]
MRTLAEYAALPLSVAGGSEPVRARVALVSKDFFKALGVQPFRGRAFTPDEQRLDGPHATIVSYGYWKRYLGGSKDLSQFHLRMNGGVYPVVGVTPRGFDFPWGAVLWTARDVYPQARSRAAHSWDCLGRVRNDATVSQARVDLDTIAQRIHAEYPSKVNLTGAAVVPLADAMVRNVRTALLTLFGAVIVLFLVAGANVAGLLLARTAARRKELAVRAALGAGRARLVRQLLTESLVLAFAGGLLGVLIAALTTNLLPAIIPADFPRQQGIAINAAVLLFTLAATLAVSVSLGLFAAWRTGRVDLSDALSAGSLHYSSGTQRLRNALVIGEIAAALMMLVGAGLLGRSFMNLISVSSGFSEHNLMVLKLSPAPSEPLLTSSAPTPQKIARRAHFLGDALARVRAIPGVQSAGVTGGVPIADPNGFPEGEFLVLNGQPPPKNFHDWETFALNRKQTGEADYCVASAGFFRTLGIPLIRGRLFNAQDGPDALNVAVISETLARQKWPNQNPIGQVIDFGNMDGNLKPLTIVGVVADIRAEGLDQPPSPIIYVDYRQRGLGVNSSPAIVLRTALPASAIAPAARTIFHEIDPNSPVQLSTFAEALGGWMAERRFLLLLVGVFAGAVLALAAVGIFGVISYLVATRTHEIGIRMALGAQKRDVLRLVVGQGMVLALTGLGIGVVGALGLTRFLSSLVYGVKPTDPLTFAAVSLILIGVALLACYIPARRATKVDPMVALRHE